MASEAMYKHLWIPKRTARDWGKTDYHIIRNWTPRVPKQANNQSDDSGNQSKQSPDYSTAAPVINPDSGGSSRVDDILDDIDNPAPADSDIAESQPKEASPGLAPASSLRSLQRVTGGASGKDDVERSENDSDKETQLLFGRKRAGPSGVTGCGENRPKRARLRHRLDSDSETERRDTEEEGERGEGEGERGGCEGSGIMNPLNRTEELGPSGEANQTLERRTLRSDKHKTHYNTVMEQVSSQPLHVAERQRVHSEAVRLGGQESLGEEEEGETESGGADNEPEVAQIRKKKTTRGKGKRTAPKSTSFKLWQSHYQRSGRDLNELDICFSLYDTAMRDAINEEAVDPVVQRALVAHWKMTKKHILSTIRDLSVVSALEKRYRQEFAKYRKLHQESLTTLKTLRQVNGQFIQTASRARSTREARKLSVEQSEIEELSREISAYVTRLKSHQ